jgi:GntR family transcriptional repressor for pyruvate dehydrogenase complex
MELKVIKKISAVDLVIEYIKEQLLEKKLVPGQKVFGENELALGLRVGRGTVREAMKILSAYGVVDIRSGDGTYIRENSCGERLNPLLFDFILYGPDRVELSQFRQVIEVAIVDLIIVNKDKNINERALLEQNFEDLRVHTKTGAPLEFFIQNDISFHRLLSKASCNHMAGKIYDFVVDFLEPEIIATHNIQKNGVYAYIVHKPIIEAIHENDLPKAQAAIKYSVKLWDAVHEGRIDEIRNLAKQEGFEHV